MTTTHPAAAAVQILPRLPSAAWWYDRSQQLAQSCKPLRCQCQVANDAANRRVFVGLAVGGRKVLSALGMNNVLPVQSFV
jgi:hypothetical protein